MSSRRRAAIAYAFLIGVGGLSLLTGDALQGGAIAFAPAARRLH